MRKNTKLLLVFLNLFIFIVISITGLFSIFPYPHLTTKAATSSEIITSLNDQLVKVAKDKRKSAQVVAIAKQRKSLLLKELESNPGAFLLHTLPVNTRKTLPQYLKDQGLIEQEIEVKGKLSVLHFDDFEKGKSKEEYKIEEKKNKVKRTYFIHFTKRLPLQSGAEIKVKGVGFGNNLAVQSEVEQNIVVTTQAPLPSTTGEQRTAVIMFDFVTTVTPTPTPANLPPFTVETVNRFIFTADNSVNKFYQEVSFNQTFFSGKVFGVFTLEGFNISKCEANSWVEAAITRIDPQELANYTRKIYLWPRVSACGYAGWAEINGDEAWINGMYADSYFRYVVAHELGHDFGLDHASSITCGTKAIDDYANCTISEYGNRYDTMGSSNLYHFGAFYKAILNWTPTAKIQNITTSGEYTIVPLEALASEGSFHGLRVKKKDTDEFYYVEYRKPIGFDATLPSGITKGADVIISKEKHAWTKLVDTHPQTQGDFSDASLSDNSDFRDEINSIIIRQITHSDSTVTLSVTLSYPTDEPVPTIPLITPRVEQPKPVQNLTIRREGNLLVLGWSASLDASSYNIYRDTVPYGLGSKIATTSNTEYHDSPPNGLGNPDRNYFYTVRAFNGVKESNYETFVGEFEYKFEPYADVFIAPPFTTLLFTDAAGFAQFSGMEQVMVVRHNNITQSIDWFIWRKTDGFIAGTNFPISPGDGFIVKKQAPEQETSIVTFVGQLPKNPPVLSLARRWNLLPISLLYTDYYLTAYPLGNAFIPYITKLYNTYFKVNDQYWYLEYKDGKWQGNDFPIIKGYTYFIELSRPVQWTYHGALIPGPRWDSPESSYHSEQIYQVYAGEEFVLQTQVSDPDTPLSNLNYEAKHQPEGGLFDKSTLQYRFTPSLSSGGDYVEITVSDSTSTDTLYFNLRFNQARTTSPTPTLSPSTPPATSTPSFTPTPAIDTPTPTAIATPTPTPQLLPTPISTVIPTPTP